MSRDEKDAIWLKSFFWSPPLSDGWRGLCSAPVAVPLPHIYRLQNKTFQTQLKKVCPLYHQLSCSYMQSKQHKKTFLQGMIVFLGWVSEALAWSRAGHR